MIISAILLAAGITLWMFFFGYAQSVRLSAQEEVNKELSVLRSEISADYIACPRGREPIIILRNVGKEPVVIYRIIIYKNEEIYWDSLNAYGVKALAEIDVNEVRTPYIMLSCPELSYEDRVTIQVHYVPRSLFDPSSPELIDPTSDVLLFRIASFEVEKTSLDIYQETCPDVPESWAWIEYVNIEDVPPEGYLGRRIDIRFAEAFKVSTMNLMIEVEDPSRKASGIGFVMGTSNETQWIKVDLSDLKYPVTIRFNVISPRNTRVLQSEWHLGAIDNSYVDYVRLLWNRLDKKLIGAYVSVFHKISGTYEVTVEVLDCYNNKVSGSLQKDVFVGAAGRWERYLISFPSSELMHNVRKIYVYITDRSAITTETRTESITLTNTITERVTYWITQPTATLTKTFTTTITRTTTVPAFTYTATVTRTATSFTTVRSTSTSTSTVVRTSVTTALTTTTQTITTYLSTATVTSTSTITLTVTSPAATRTATTTTSIPTATRTVTSTAILTATVPVTTITSTQTQTTTVTSTPPPSTSTVTQTLTSTVATTTLRTTTTSGTTVTSTVTRTTTITSCPLSASQHSPNAAFALGLLVPIIFAPIIRRCRK